MNTQPKADTQPKTKTITIVTFIDALGWEVLKDRKFMQQELRYRQALKSVLGYSSACVPSILSGLAPKDHGHWSFYYYDKLNSPFKWFSCLRFLPFQSRGRVRHLISKIARKILGWSGYFQFYNMPFRYIRLFNYCEKKDLFQPGGLNQGASIFDYLQLAKVPYHVSNWQQSEEENIHSIKQALGQGKIRFSFLYLAAMDALLHQVGKHHPSVDDKLQWYERQLKDVMAVAHQHYDEVRLYICSDHGMATVEHTVDLMAEIKQLDLSFGSDYVAAYDSTMARFWFHKASARLAVKQALANSPWGHFLTAEELSALGCDFDQQRYGEEIFLLHAGNIICPSDMGRKPITGMHGYHPHDADSYASLLSNVKPITQLKAITDLCDLMRLEAGC